MHKKEIKKHSNLFSNESEEDEEEPRFNISKNISKQNNFNNNNHFNYSTTYSDSNKYNCPKQREKNCSKSSRSRTPNCQYEKEPACNSEKIRKKFNRVNQIFYNGTLNKQDKHCEIPEYQEHASELLHFLKDLWQTGKMCDLSIVVGNRKYPAHRLGLAMFSPKYKEEFQKNLNKKETGVYTICLKNSTHLAVEAIIKYIYTAKIDINPSNVEEILEAAKELGVEDLICMANDYLNSLSIGDVLDYMGNILNKEGSEQMFYELYAYFMTHLDKISRTPEFLKSSIYVVNALLGDSHLSVCGELEVFDAGMRWIEYDKQRRSKYLYDVLKNIRFTLMCPDEIVAKIENQIDPNENINIFRLLFNAYKFHALNSNQSKLNNFIKKEEFRNICLKGASVPDAFEKAIIELSQIAHKLKTKRAYNSNKILD